MKKEENFGIIDLDKTDTIPVIADDEAILSGEADLNESLNESLDEYAADEGEELSEELLEEYSEEFEEDFSEEYSEELSEEYSEELNEEYSDEYSDEYADEFSEEYNDEYNEEYNEEYSEEFNEDFEDEYEEDLSIVEDEFNDFAEESELEKLENLNKSAKLQNSEVTYDEENRSDNVFKGQIEYVDDDLLANISEEPEPESGEEVIREAKKETKKEAKKEAKKEKQPKANQAEAKQANVKQTNVKQTNTKQAKSKQTDSKQAKNEKSGFKDKLIAAIKGMTPSEWGLVGGALIVLIMVIVVIVAFVNKKSGNADNSGGMEIASVGQKIESLGVAGESGLISVTDAVLFAQNEADEYYEEEIVLEETDEIRITFTSLEKDLKIKFINTGTDKLVSGIEFDVILTSAKGKELEYKDSDLDGIIYETGMDAGDYSVTVKDVDGYTYLAYDSTVNIKDKIVYKQIDVSQEVKKEAEINVAQEDTAINNVQAEAEASYNKDTVEWVESTKTASDGSDGYKKIDKSSIKEPTYAFRNVISVDNEFCASNLSVLSKYNKISVIRRDPDESENSNLDDDSDNNDDNNNNNENKTEDKTASISFGDSKTVKVDNSISLSPSAECDGNSLPSSGFKDYSSSNTSVATVDSSGKVTGKSEGETTIKVKYECTITEDGVKKNYTGEGSVKVTVTKDKVTVSSIELNKTSMSLTPNGTDTIEAKVKMSDDSTVTSGIKFTSGDEKIAKVDKETGKVTAVAKGETKITVSYTDSNDNKKEVTVTVTVSDLKVKEISLSKDNTSIAAGKTETIAPTAVMTDDTKITDSGKFNYTSSDEKIAKVDANGVITALKTGEVKITVKHSSDDSKSATLVVKVVENAENDTSSKLVDKDGNQVYVKNSDGKYVEATFADYYKDHDFYIVSESGYKYTGWQTINGNVYYYDKNGNKVTGEQIIQGVTYKFTDDGILKMDNGSTMGIDVSKWNGTIDWNAVKNSGVSFVIIRCGYRGSTSGVLVEDPKFKSNIQGAQAAGLKVGVYFFTQAVNEVEAVEEASMVLGLIRNYSISYPVFIDTEKSGGRGDRIDKATRTAVCVAFCETIKSGGYTPGVYASKSWYNDNLSYGSISGYKIWLAQYASQPTFSNRYDIWQHSEKGSISGISGKVDLNISYMGY